METFVGNALFGDGSGSLVVGVRPTEKERTLWVIENTTSRILEHTPTLMTWEASDHGSLPNLLDSRGEAACHSSVPSFAALFRFSDEALAEDPRIPQVAGA